jgi:carboxypeptidase C (cathepsin A)
MLGGDIGMKLLGTLAAVATVVVSSTLSAQQSGAVADAVQTEHQVNVGGKPLRYTARTGHLPIRDNETGEIHGQMFFVAYSVAQEPGTPRRPVTFLWNGGPGASSSLVHLLGFGPRRLDSSGAALDNQGTWLEFSDLVFVDPIGTGYSRPVKAEYGAEFYQTRGDAESVAEFIRVYRHRFAAWDAPVFLAGESFGVTRAAGVADVLERRGVTVSGVMLIGLAVPLGQLTGPQRIALNVPTYTAAAFTHKKLAPELLADLQSTLRKAEAWAVNRYAPALGRRDTLSDAERNDVAMELAAWTGMSAAAIDRKTLAIAMPQFSDGLLGDRRLSVGRYDSRLTAPFDLEQQKMYDPTKDPSLKNIIDDVGVVRYFRSVLRFESDLPYQGPFGGGYPPATAFRGDWMSVKWRWTPGERSSDPAGEQDQPLRRAMQANPSLKVLVACGYFDLVCSYFANEYVVSQLAPELRSRVSVKSYGGGHAIYTEDAVRPAMKRDAAAFVQAATAGTPPIAARQREQAQVPPRPVEDDEPAISRHQVTLKGRTLSYTARAGRLPIAVNETGEVHGRMFYVAYTLDQAASPSSRPLTFVWNGGPGANSSLLHLTGFGPRRIRTMHETGGECECELQDNEATWLEFTDLVFVDPVGTGFSRPTRADYGAEFYNSMGDIAATAEMIRVYLTRFDAWRRPLFLAGESYGTWRASGVAEMLELRGRHVAGVILISGGVQVGSFMDEELRTALFLPTRAAAAFHHKNLAPELQVDLTATLREVETWARSEYAPALKRVGGLSDAEREAIAARLARYSGVNPQLIDRQTLLIGRQAFAEQLLRDSKQVLARFDTRFREDAARGGSRWRETVQRYLRSDLRFATDLAYAGAEMGFTPGNQNSVGARWDYNQNPQAAPARPQNTDGPPGGAQPWLRRAMQINPSLKAFVATGLWDSLNSCAVHDALPSAIEPAIGRNITAACYRGGHMMYDDPAVRLQVTRDIAAFVEGAKQP